MDINKELKRNNPFGALIRISSLIAAILFVAGFAFRWSYYYNFGVPNLVFNMNPSVVLITAFELVREPVNLLYSLVFIVIPFVIVSQIIKLKIAIPFKKKNITIRLNPNGLFSDFIKAFLLFYLTFMVSSQIGYHAFKKVIVHSNNNPLPLVNVIFENDSKLKCTGITDEDISFIGNPEVISSLSREYLGCNNDTFIWRLLHQDKDNIYLFASQPDSIIKGKRPLTVVIPSSRNYTLILNR